MTRETFEVSGVTSILVNRQTISTEDANGRLQAGDVGLTAANLGLEVTYYITPRFGIGALSPTNACRPSLPIGARCSTSPADSLDHWRRCVALGRSVGVCHCRFGRRNQDEPDEPEHRGLEQCRDERRGEILARGRWIELSGVPNASVDLGLRYQSSTFSGPGSQDGRTTAAGLLVGIAFSLFIH